MGDIRCRKGAELCSLHRVSAWRDPRAREKETLSPDVVMEYSPKAGIVITF